MADFKFFSDPVTNIMKDAVYQAKKYNHTIVNSVHLYNALLAQLVSYKKRFELGEDNDEVVNGNKIFQDIKEILNRHSVTGQEFEKSFLEYFPKGEEEAQTEYDEEYKRIYSDVRNFAIEAKQPATIEDLIVAIFSDNAYKLFIVLSSVVNSDQETRDLYNEILDRFKRKAVPKIDDLEEIRELTNINTWVTEHPQVVLNADDAINKLLVVLRNRSINNPVLIGPAGCGKTTYLYELAQRINSGNVPEYFKNKIIYQLDPTALTAGTMFRGALEEKVMNILDVVKEHKEVILFMDELHALMDAGGGTEGASNVGQMLKPYITRNDVQIIGATTNEEYRKYIAKDKAFASRFKEVLVNEPTKEELKEILKGLLPVENEFFEKDVREDLIDSVVDLSNRYSIDLGNPRKAIVMLESACSYAAIFRQQDKEVSVEELMKAVALQYDVCISKTKTKDTYEALKEKLLGEDRAISEIARNLYAVEKNIGVPGKPRKSMIFAGPTGTGKTEAAKIIAKYFCGSENNLIKISMSTYTTEDAVSKLIGSNPGLIGSDDETELIKGIRQHPNSVVLFDEFEKAHIKVVKTLMDVLDEGYLTDNKGDKISFRNAIIIFTTNLGCNKDTGKAVGMGLVKHKVTNNHDDIMKAIENHFALTPEVLTRVNDIVIYDNLSNDVVREITRRAAEEVLSDSEVKYELTEEDYQEIEKNSDIVAYGARNIKECTEKQITTKLLENSELSEIIGNLVKEDK